MRELITNINKDLNPDQLYAFACEYNYDVKGNNVDDATIPEKDVNRLIKQFKDANKKEDWRKNLVAESLNELFEINKLLK